MTICCADSPTEPVATAQPIRPAHTSFELTYEASVHHRRCSRPELSRSSRVATSTLGLLPMLHVILMAAASAALFMLNRFVEVSSPYPLGSHAVYGQLGGALVCVVGSCVGAFILHRQHRGSIRSQLRYAAALWALPLTWRHWYVDSYSTTSGNLSVRHGIGGTFGWEFLVAGAVALVFLDAVLRSSSQRAIPA